LTKSEVGELGIDSVLPGLVSLVEFFHEFSSEGGLRSQEGILGVLNLNGSSESVLDGGEEDGLLLVLELTGLLKENSGEESTEVESGDSPFLMLSSGESSLECVKDINTVKQDILHGIKDEGLEVSESVEHINEGLNFILVRSASLKDLRDDLKSLSESLKSFSDLEEVERGNLLESLINDSNMSTDISNALLILIDSDIERVSLNQSLDEEINSADIELRDSSLVEFLEGVGDSNSFGSEVLLVVLENGFEHFIFSINEEFGLWEVSQGLALDNCQGNSVDLRLFVGVGADCKEKEKGKVSETHGN
jgi:hypothetical protein